MAAFEAGSAGSFDLPAMKDLGQLRQLTLELTDDKGDSQQCSWHCQHLEVTNISSGEVWLFPCNAWLGRRPASSKAVAGLQTPADPAARISSGKPDSRSSSTLLVLYPAADLEAMRQQQQLELEQLQKEEYQVQVYTSDQSTAGTTPPVSITLVGSSGEEGPVPLLGKGPHALFRPGMCDVFHITALKKLGRLLKLKVTSSGDGAGHAWQLDTVAVTAKATGVTSWFLADRWLDQQPGLDVTLEASDTDIRGQLIAYQVTTFTSDLPGAGSDARVFIDLHGSNNGSSTASGTLQLAYPVPKSSPSSISKPFARSQRDSFVIRCKELGQLSELLVWHDNSGGEPSWHLAHIEVHNVSTGQVWYFSCDQWLDDQRGVAATRRLLRAADALPPSSRQCNYRLTVTTGNVRGAGTDANVFVVVHGRQGTSRQLALGGADRGNMFKRGQRDAFTVLGQDVGEMTHLVIGHDNSGLTPAWYVEAVQLEHLGTGQLLEFIIGRWLDAKRDPGALQLELWPGPGARQPGAQPQLQAADGSTKQQHQQQHHTAWQLVVITGRVFGAGTDADVFIELHGQHAGFGPYTLPAGPDAFETGRRDSFTFNTPELGELISLVIGHNNMGAAAAWFLQGLELTNTNIGDKYAFNVAGWLNTQNGCSRALKAVPQQRRLAAAGSRDGDGTAAQGLCSYQVEIQTSDVDGAGTDAAVFVQIIGAGGRETQAMQLQQAPGCRGAGQHLSEPRSAALQRGALDVFVLRGLVDVGPLAYLNIGHDGSGSHPAWHLSWVKVINLTTAARAVFTCNAWMDPSRADSDDSWVKLPADFDVQGSVAHTGSMGSTTGGQQLQLSRDPHRAHGDCSVLSSQQVDASTAAAPSGFKLKRWLHVSRSGQPGYKLTIVTSNIWGAGTASRVFMELIGELGSSGIMFLTAQQGQFSRGHEDTLLYPRLPYLGQLHQLRIGTDGSGMFAAWHLTRVEVVHVQSGHSWLFDCHDWIDRRCSWQKLLPAIPT
eukprot:gene13432-13560_t